MIALGCVAHFYVDLVVSLLLKPKHNFSGWIPLLTGQACSAGDCLEQSSCAAQPSVYDLTFSFFNCISCFWQLKGEVIMSDTDNSRKPRTEKTVKQKIASAQMRLNRLKTKEKLLTKSAETRLKIILGAEVAKANGCKIEDVDKEFVLGLILYFQSVSAEDKIKFQILGKRFLADMIGRQQ